MNIRLYRSAAPGCPQPCAEWIAADGAIVPESLRQLGKVLRSLSGRRVPLLLNSPGGRIETALAMGRLIRSKHLDVAVGKTMPMTCDATRPNCVSADSTGVPFGIPTAGSARCASACVLLLAAGEERLVPPGTSVGVHQMILRGVLSKVLRRFQTVRRLVQGVPTEVNRKLIDVKVLSRTPFQRPSPPAAYDEIERYFAGMGLKPGLMAPLRSTPPTSIYWLMTAELEKTELATSFLGGDYLVGRENARIAEVRQAAALLPSGQAPTQHAAAIRKIEADAESSERATLLLRSADQVWAPALEGRTWWRLSEPGPGGSGPVLQAEIDVPRSRFRATFRMRRNADPRYAASYLLTIDWANDPSGGLPQITSFANPEIRVIDTEPGVKLQPLAFSVSSAGSAVIGLPSDPGLESRDFVILGLGGSLALPFKTATGGDGVLVLEKGASGEKAIRDATQAWSRAAQAKTAGLPHDWSGSHRDHGVMADRLGHRL